MLRRFSIGVGAAWLAVASFQAPFAHVHPEDPEHRHAQGLIHGHFDLDHHAGEAVEDKDHSESAVWLDWAPAAQARMDVVYTAKAAPFQEAPLPVSLGSVPEFSPRSHSPPRLRSLPARAPPV